MKNKEFKTKHCVVCQSDDYEHVSNKGQMRIHIHVALCKRCGLTYLNPCWTEESYADFYKNDYDRLYRSNHKTERFDLEQHKYRRYGYYPVWLRLLDAGLQRSQIKNVLDVGAGNGHNLEYLKHRLPQSTSFYAIEPSAGCVDVLKNKNFKFLSHDINEDWPGISDVKFDLILFRHVVEHLDDPLFTLKKVRELLTEDGLIYIAVPNTLKVKNESLKDLYFRAVHTYYFTPNSISNISRLAGYEIVSIEEGDYFNSTEIFLVLRPGELNSLSRDEIKNEYQELLALFNLRKKYERSIKYILDKIIGKMRSKMYYAHRKFFPFSSFLNN